MKTIVFDLELNQPSAKIIQIGAILADLKTLSVGETFNIYVDPQEPIDQYIVDLTGISDKIILESKAKVLVESLVMFRKWANDVGCDHFTAWGSDFHLLRSQASAAGYTKFDQSRRADLKTGLDILGLKGKGGLKKTMDKLGIPFDGKQHDALCDALNTAKLMFYFLNKLKGE